MVKLVWGKQKIDWFCKFKENQRKIVASAYIIYMYKSIRVMLETIFLFFSYFTMLRWQF